MIHANGQDKKRYANEQQAENRLATIWSRGAKGSRMPIRSYPCPECKGWHLTSKPKHR